ncbi:hypothetical protein F5Y12DRAFT_796004 [Xylaria sp. FL1777]|nr:hypothetical protein F5Y12DRAFT_796004 [Xylaria sp. FL1777]
MEEAAYPLPASLEKQVPQQHNLGCFRNSPPFSLNSRVVFQFVDCKRAALNYFQHSPSLPELGRVEALEDTMSGQLVSDSGFLPPLSINRDSTSVCTECSGFQTATQQSSIANEPLELGEIPASEIKQEERVHSGNVSQSPFAHVAVTTDATSPFCQSGQTTFGGISRSAIAIQRRNHERLNKIVARLQNVNGSVTELLAIAGVQQQLDVAFADLDHARIQLRDILGQFETQGRMSKRQNQKRNGATRDLLKSSQRITQLMQELWVLQGREPSGS